MFSRSPSLVAVTQEVLLFHYPASSVSGRQRFTGIPLQNHHRAFALWINGTCCKYYTLQHPSQAAPSHLPITHCWAHAVCKDVGWGSLAHGNASSGEKTQEKNVTITVLLFIYKQVRVYFFQGEQPDKEKTVHDDAFHIKYSWLKKKHNQKMCCVVFHYLVSLSREIKRRRRSIKGQMSQSSGSSKTFLRVDCLSKYLREKAPISFSSLPLLFGKRSYSDTETHSLLSNFSRTE